MPMNPEAEPVPVPVLERISGRISATARRYHEVALVTYGLVAGALLVVLGSLLN